MTDAQLFELIMAGMLAAASVRAGVTVDVKQNYQPTQQGAQTAPTLYVHKLFDKRVGHVQRKDVLDIPNDVFRHHEAQWYETTFQVTALAAGNPLVPNLPSASDLVNVGADIMQSDAMMARLRAANVGVLRVGEITNPQFVDDRDRFEASPSFDFVLTHKREYIDGVPVVSSVEFNFARV